MKVGDVIQIPGWQRIPMRVMKVEDNTITTVHWEEWRVLKTDDLDRYASINTVDRSELE